MTCGKVFTPWIKRILIHTSVKLVTRFLNGDENKAVILIHTSVKLVTQLKEDKRRALNILIHTSVKLVTLL